MFSPEIFLNLQILFLCRIYMYINFILWILFFTIILRVTGICGKTWG
jgi:hypothetical protein